MVSVVERGFVKTGQEILHSSSPEFFFPRKETHDELLKRYLELSFPFGPDLFVRSLPVVVPRDIFPRAGVSWKITDTLWSRDYPDGNIPSDAVNRVLDVEISKNIFSIGSKPDNFKISLIFNTQGPLFTLKPRKYDDARDFSNSNMANLTLDFIDKWEDKGEWNGDVQAARARRKYEYDDPEIIEHHGKVAESLLNVYEIMLRENYLSPR